MNKLKENTDGTQENGFQKSLYKMAKITFVDLCKSYCIALVVFVFLGVLSSYSWGNILLQILLLVGFGYPIYCNAWGEGYQDLNRYEFKRIKLDKFRGFKFGLLALIPQFILSVIIIFSYITGLFEIMFIYRIANLHALPILNLITDPQIYTIDYSIIQMLLYVVIPPTITISFIGAGYYLGFSDFAIMDKIIYKKKTN